MANLQERDIMVCRSCGKEDRASEGYPCVQCGAFICLMCDMRGITRCRKCQTELESSSRKPETK